MEKMKCHFCIVPLQTDVYFVVYFHLKKFKAENEYKFKRSKFELANIYYKFFASVLKTFK